MKTLIIILFFCLQSHAVMKCVSGRASFNNSAIRNTAYNFLVQKSSPCIYATPEVYKYDFVAVGTTPAYYELYFGGIYFNVSEKFYNKIVDYVNDSMKVSANVIRAKIFAWDSNIDINKSPENVNAIMEKP